MMISDEILIGFIAAIAGFVAWIIRFQLTSMKDTIDRNTQAVAGVLIIVEQCKRK